MYITPLTSPHIPAAAALFTRGYRRLRQSVPSMPERMASDALIAEMLAGLLDQSYAFGAFEGETLLGYLGGWVFDGFRGTPRRAV